MSESKGLMAGKRGLIMGVANNRSIGWGIAQACARHGAELAFTYQGDALKKRVEPLASGIGSKLVLPCDVTDMASIDQTFAAIGKEWGEIDFVVHAIAFSDKDELTGRYVDTTVETERVDIGEALARLRELERERDAAVADMNRLLAELGYA